MRIATTFLCILIVASCSKRSERVAEHLPKPTPAGDEAKWFQTLRPGITRDEVHELAGSPTSQEGNCDLYDLPIGRLKLEYLGSLLIDCSHLNPGEGAVAIFYYTAWDGDLLPEHLNARREYLRRPDFANLNGFEGPRVRTSLHDGLCYLLDDGYIVIKLIVDFGTGTGFFCGKPALVTLVAKDGAKTVLYRASDHWANLRPPNVSKAEVERRTALLRNLGAEPVRNNILKLLGPEDSTTGSGIVRSIYYIADGLYEFPFGSIIRPGIGKVTLTEWLDERQ
jgi:hypothetical protein